jgi:hypothetical protein
VAAVGDGDLEAQRGGEVVHPAGGVAGLADDQRARRLIARLDAPDEEVVQRRRRGGDRPKRVPPRGRVHRAGDGVELAQVQCDDRFEAHAILLW